MNDDLECDYSTYDLLFCPITPWPCLSFDFIYDSQAKEDYVSKLKINGNEFKGNELIYPIEVTCVSGTQATDKKSNCIYVIKWGNLNKLDLYLSSEEISSDDEKVENKKSIEKNNSDNNKPSEDDSVIICKSIKHIHGCINKIKNNKKINSLVGAWCEDKKVYIYEIRDEINGLNERMYNENIQKDPVYIFNKHSNEGFAIDWNPVYGAQLLTGDNDGNLFLWLPDNMTKWKHEKLISPSIGVNCNKYSIETIQWAKHGNGVGHVFAMCSSDKSIKIVDTRDIKSGSGDSQMQNLVNRENRFKMDIPNAHSSDVNVITWNENFEFLLASGGDDSLVKIWDIRNTSKNVASLNFHKDSITSISWDSKDTYVVLASSLDNSISVWDLSVESEALEHSVAQYPDQLLFEHKNQNFITDAKFHPYYPGVIVSTSGECFNIFKPYNT
ncbi:ribosome assembly protein RRB1, putative [Plasmodium chabaudi chabaudi]|uniref:Ribosome assembly protein RRB1, putative n=1 Tax=Plasmodium chabaudi chabaudi TaxID=31271 RepID=A0A4V0K574_PLACU|nr:ribosome assembly protein RRB1, putative [Plasmodium chabaudi chabaudi]VTZ68109.1 ribosome assembly protein RRB1, putative [Plasmodium chabaudi chabaudi]|eukprot:XP_743523.2 nucleolar preribosomal assembly protein, putative [Plasmodium chabaudi chabaudi]